MSGVVIVAPTIAMAAWPAVATAASAVLVAMGFVAVDETVRTITKEYVNVSGGVKEKVGSGVRTEVELELSNAEEVGASIGREQQLVFVKDDIEVRFSRDVRGRMRVCVTGDSHPKAELEELGRTLAGRVIQQYVYARVVEEMKNRTGMELVEQTVDDEDNIRIKLCSWEE
ncbi:hypothetical protein [Victivallis lenta]|uniref:hypothetical protein n=1 Tax=Victivallis lenta TaxID=2606640 RepID=UPI00235421B3|nr:hypothetical protein [Victivallis lenta]